MIAGPELPETLSEHSMVAFGLGQAIIGGKSNFIIRKKISQLECSGGDCEINKIADLAIERSMLVAFPIPDFFSGCISQGKEYTLRNKV